MLLSHGWSGYDEPGRAELGCRVVAARALEELEPETRAAHALAREGDRRRLQVRPRRVDVGRVAQPELDVHGSGDANQLRNLVMPHEAAAVVGRLDVDVERDVDRGADRGDLRQPQVRREVDRRRAEPLE